MDRLFAVCSLISTKLPGHVHVDMHLGRGVLPRRRLSACLSPPASSARFPRRRPLGGSIVQRCAISGEEPPGDNAGNYSDSSDEGGPSVEPHGAQRADRLKHATARLLEQQEILGKVQCSTEERQEVKRIVETSMLAAITGLAYTISTLLKLEGYLSYVLPLPVVLSAMRSDDIYTPIQCVLVIFLLLFILLGPVRAVTYALVYGLLSISLGVSFKAGIPWGLGVPLGACARLLGQWLYIMVTSWVTNENLLELLVSNAHTLLENMSVWMGGASSTSFNGVAITLISMLAVNALFYVYMMTLLYTILLRSMGYNVKQKLPRLVTRMMANQAGP
jgi:hypothetical protein